MEGRRAAGDPEEDMGAKDTVVGVICLVLVIF